MTAEHLAERIWIELVEAVRAGDVPAAVPSFSAVHDYLDANMLGDPQIPEGETEAFIATLDQAQWLVDARIRSGELLNVR